jgi:hypothetical protein
MYSPQCAAQLVDSDKFCRACGADLKAAALALAKQPLSSKARKKKTVAPEEEKKRLENRGQGIRKATEGATMLVASLLAGLLIPLIFHHKDPMEIWAVFFGWIACMGVFRLASGLGAVMQAASMGSIEAKAVAPQPVDEPVAIPDTDPLADPNPYHSLSVKENTTRSLEPAPQESFAKE